MKIVVLELDIVERQVQFQSFYSQTNLNVVLLVCLNVGAFCKSVERTTNSKLVTPDPRALGTSAL